MDQIQSLEWLCQERLNLQDILDDYFSSTLNEYDHVEYPLRPCISLGTDMFDHNITLKRSK